MAACICRVFAASFLVVLVASTPERERYSHLYASAAAQESDWPTRVTDLVNGERVAQGLAPLTESPQLNGAAQAYSELMASSGCFAHTCGAEPDPGRRARNSDYQGLCCWENI